MDDTQIYCKIRSKRFWVKLYNDNFLSREIQNVERFYSVRQILIEFILQNIILTRIPFVR